jgi:hypothetical protein
MLEATTKTILQDDPDRFAVQVGKFHVVDLESRGESDLQVVEMRLFWIQNLCRQERHLCKWSHLLASLKVKLSRYSQEPLSRVVWSHTLEGLTVFTIP